MSTIIAYFWQMSLTPVCQGVWAVFANVDIAGDYGSREVVLTMSNTHDPQNADSQSLATAAFLCGWACAHEAHLPTLPEALVQGLGLASAQVEILQPGSEQVRRFAFAQPEQPHAADRTAFRIEQLLDRDHLLRLDARLGENQSLAESQKLLLQHLGELARGALACVLLGQNDRRLLGHPVDSLSDREWEVCLALETPRSERQIALALNCSMSTIHTHVKAIYRKLQARSRRHVIEVLHKARGEYRRRAIRVFRPQPDARAESAA